MESFSKSRYQTEPQKDKAEIDMIDIMPKRVQRGAANDASEGSMLNVWHGILLPRMWKL